MSDAGAEQRERRRQQMKKQGGAGFDPAKLRKFIPWALVLLIAGGVVAGMVYTAAQGDKCPGHWHAGFTVFVEDERLPFTDARFFNQQNDFAPGTHVHGDDGIYHFHPAVGRCTPWQDALRLLGVQVQEDNLVLDELHGPWAGTYTQNGTHDVKLFYKPLNGDWEEVTNFRKILREQPPDGSSIMISYGVLDEATIESQLARARTLEGGSYDPSRGQ